jgi:hypothetical protein
MAKPKKLKVGDRVICRFLGAKDIGTVTEITAPGQYKVKLDRGTILPKSEWYDPTDKKHAAKPWHIHEYVGCTELNKTELNSDIPKDTLDKKELKDAIKKQKDFIRGRAKK